MAAILIVRIWNNPDHSKPELFTIQKPNFLPLENGTLKYSVLGWRLVFLVRISSPYCKTIVHLLFSSRKMMGHEEVMKQKMKLPIYQFKKQFLHAFENNPVRLKVNYENIHRVYVVKSFCWFFYHSFSLPGFQESMIFLFLKRVLRTSVAWLTLDNNRFDCHLRHWMDMKPFDRCTHLTIWMASILSL